MQRQVSTVVAIALVGAAVLTAGAGLALAQEDATPTPADNETRSEGATPVDQHDDPRNVSEEGDLGQLSEWLSGHLSGRLEDGMVELSQGQYDSVEGLVGDEFESRLSQFADVAGETNAESDDAAAESMQTVADDQQEFGTDVQGYRETLEAYRDARERGDNAAAREHARELEEMAQDVQATGRELRSGYRSIGNATGRDFTEGVDAVETIVTNVSTTQEEVREVTFVETDITATANRSVAAFDRPATIEGQVVAANGSALANRPVTIGVGARTLSTTTDAQGRFSLTYRPIRIRTDVTSVPVTFQPRQDSVYLDSRDNVSLGIEAVEPTVAVTTAPDAVAFGETVPVEATVHVDGRPVPIAPVSVTVDERSLAQANTSADGVLRVTPLLPADVPAGQRTVGVTVGAEGRAISPAAATASVQVEETATQLTVAASEFEGAVAVTGRLGTANGTAVADQSVTIGAGATTETVTTNASGAFETTLDGESLGDPGTELTVSATFDGGGTNLAGASASTTVTVPGDGGGAESGDAFLGEVPWLVVGTGVVALALLAGVILLSLRWSRSGAGDASAPEPTGIVDDRGRQVSDADRWIDAASDALASGDERGAVARAYAASYARLQERLELGDEHTPRELLVAAEGRVDESVFEALRRVTDAYERMAFAGGRPGGASEVLDGARTVVEGQRPGTSTDDD